MTVRTAVLGDVVDIDTKVVNPDSIDDGTPYIGLESIGTAGDVDESVTVAAGELKSAKFAYDDRHVLFGKLRPNLGKVARPSKAGVCSTDILPLLPSSSVDRDYLAHFLLTPASIALAASRTTGVNLPRLSGNVLKSFEIPLPALEEQRQVAAVLERVDLLRARRRQTIALFGDSVRSRFVQLFERDDGAIVKTVPFGEIVKESQLGLVRAARDLGPVGTAAYIRMNAIGSDGEFRRVDQLRTMVSQSELAVFGLKSGDFLFNTRNSRELVGKSAVFEGDEIAVFNNNILRLRFHGVTPEYIAAAFQRPAVRQQLTARKSGTTNVFAIYYRDLATVKIGLPSLESQREFTGFVDRVHALKAAALAHLAELDELFSALQARFFRI